MDDLDKKIINELASNGRESYTNMAAEFNVSEGTIRSRVKNLMKNKIACFQAVIIPGSIGYRTIALMALQVRVADLEQVAAHLIDLPNIYYLAFVTGRYDLVAIIMSRSNEELAEFIKQHISTLPSVIRTETLINLEILKSPWTKSWDIYKLL